MAVSWLDVALAAYVLLHGVTGYQQGIFLGGAGFAILVGAWGLGVAAGPEVAYLFGGPSWLYKALVAVAVYAGLKLAQAYLVRRLGAKLQGHPRWQVVDRWLGLLPGLAWGILGAGVVAWFMFAFSGALPPGSRLASALLACVQGPLSTLGQGVGN
jgi:hypothetical protein